MKIQPKVIVITILILILIILFIRYENKLTFIKYLPITMERNLSYTIDDYKISVPLHKFVFIKDIDLYLKPSIRYLTFLGLEEISEFYDMAKQNAEENYKVYNFHGKSLYYNEINNTFIQIPEYCYVEGEKMTVKKIRLTLIDNHTLRKIIEDN